MRRCVDRNSHSGLLPHLHTANTARDLNRLRADVGDRKLSYLGFSYGTQIGATYATLFPGRVRALALDGAVDAEGFVNNPIRDSTTPDPGISRRLSAASWPPAARDRTTAGWVPPTRAPPTTPSREQLDRQAVPAPESEHPAPVDGDDLRSATSLLLSQKQLWPLLSDALILAQTGDGSSLRVFDDFFYEREGPSVLDPFVAIYALDGRWPAKPALHLRDGRSAYRRFHHFWWNAGYSTLALGLWPVKPQGAYYGPVQNSSRATAALVVGTTHDPATPYVWAKRLTAEPRQRSAAHHARGRPHGVLRQQLALHRRCGAGLPGGAQAAQATHRVQAGRSVRRAAADGRTSG